jgi:predicted transcriptional regulator
MERDAGDGMSTTTVTVPLSKETRERLQEVAARSHKSEAQVAATLIEGALAVDDLEAEMIRQRLAQADAGGPFARQQDVLAWLKALSDGQDADPPKATIVR